MGAFSPLLWSHAGHFFPNLWGEVVQTGSFRGGSGHMRTFVSPGEELGTPPYNILYWAEQPGHRESYVFRHVAGGCLHSLMTAVGF